MTQLLTADLADRCVDTLVTDDSRDRRKALVVASLEARFGPAVDPAVIRAEVESGFAAYAEARVHEFIPILVEARVRARLCRPPAS